ncbi:2-oxoglutarate dehydrogenase E1 component [Mesorhizobium sp.]|uniref:2-oxoglutarate dehydrogenase E1 component n=1 Tax=Mesorhizobium sp. TaxID=1871066 RepID=UPI002600A5FF|nr:2-oxoglutarate dehydrogenase E1 component [Mesorhizobium sp.]
MTLPLSGDSAFFLDLYARFVKDPASVPADWRVKLALMEAPAQASADNGDRMADLFRTYGHRQARLDPLEMSAPSLIPELNSIEDGEECVALTLAGEEVSLPKAQAIATLGAVYCGTATLEASHVIDAGERAWVYERFEREILGKPDQDVYVRTLEAVMLADEFEHFIKTKWPTKKRFGMEGAESSAVISREIFRCAAEAGVTEVVIGGMHRGRLATLATVLGKSLPALIAEIKGQDITDGDATFTGDVPYHNGLAAEIDTGAGQVAVRLLPHPSHLIVVAPVAVGAARARQEQKANAGTNGASQVLPLLMHTDAAFAGQGLVWELLQLSALAGYSVGGTVHLIVNNQIGFTTLPSEGRSSPHPSDIGKAFGVPIFHVNGEDPIAAAAVTRVAVAWRNATGKDAIIDLVCYRRNGHNELDEPRFTQPLTWSKVDDRPTLKQLHSDRVKAVSATAFDMAEAKRRAFHLALDRAYATYDQVCNSEPERQTDIFAPPQPAGALPFGIVTGVARNRLLDLARRMTTVGDGFEADPKVRNFLTTRLEAIETNSGFNFATAEALAFASLLDEGTSVRLSGQDSVRGTFTQRHLALHDRRTGQTAMPLAGLVRAGARFDAVNSPLIEYGVLSFEYGMSLADPTRLVVWEAQFGDFLNGAQVVVDQFIVTAEAKWRMSSGLIIALPHGLEGQGPDHSSARIERILQSCAGGNLVVANPSTPANLFHLYRRQVRGTIRKPLFLIAPKSLLRLRGCVSILDEIAEGTSFQPVIVESPSASTCSKVVLCSGKIAYALKAAAAQERINDVALVRVEQLYPFPSEAIGAILERFQGVPIVWCQEEPSNQGAWSFVRDRLSEMAPDRPLAYVGRPAMAAAAGGSIDRHDVEQGDIIAAALLPAVRAQAAE